MTLLDVPNAPLSPHPQRIRAKYRDERETRLLAANHRYSDNSGSLDRHYEDPNAAPFERAPRSGMIEVLIVGGGLSGLLLAARLAQAGVSDVWLAETGAGVGGTWYWNRYPGARCDTNSYVYMPLLEELGVMPSEKYAGAPEIRSHCETIARHFDIYRNALLQTAVTKCRWDDDIARWVVETDRGDRLCSRFLCVAVGPLHRPKIPAIPGLESFVGHSFHTARWDFSYTGGDHSGGLVGLRDKRVGIIGTGASAVQCIPHLARDARELFVFQRTPVAVDVLSNENTDPEWASTLSPGWQRRRMANFNDLFSGRLESVDLVSDVWSGLVRSLLDAASRIGDDFSPSGINRAIELADSERMEAQRARVEALVRDPHTAEVLKPWFRNFCKRPCFSDEYLTTFNRPNVTLVDTQGQGVERITLTGVVAAGIEYPLDCLIYATGFQANPIYARRTGFEIHGRSQTLTEKETDGPATFHGLHSRGFPNCFILRNTQTTVTVNYPHLMDELSRHVAYIVRRSLEAGYNTVESTQEAELNWVTDIVRSAAQDPSALQSCTPSYHNHEGNTGLHNHRYGTFGGGSVAFFDLLARWRADDTMAGLECR